MGKKSKKQWYPGKWVPWQSPEGKEWLVDNPKGEGILWGLMLIPHCIGSRSSVDERREKCEVYE